MEISLVHERRLWIAGTILVGSLLLVLIGWWGYGKYAEARDRRAQLAFVEQLERFEAVRNNPDADSIAWEAIEQGFARGYAEHSGSSLAPFFLAFQADVLLRKGHADEARATMDRAVASMPKNSDITSLYAIKKAVMELDSDNKEVSEKGKRNLLDLAQDSYNNSQGLAWYHLLQYAIIHNDQAIYKLAYNKLQLYPALAQQAQFMLQEGFAEGDE